MFGNEVGEVVMEIDMGCIVFYDYVVVGFRGVVFEESDD